MAAIRPTVTELNSQRSTGPASHTVAKFDHCSVSGTSRLSNTCSLGFSDADTSHTKG